jgi:AhpC/TSA antioxidant enzyme
MASMDLYSIFEGLSLFGIVKETRGVEGLSEFSRESFAFRPLYGDSSYAFYQALGDRKVPLSQLITPAAIMGIVCDTYRRSVTKRKSLLTRATSDGSANSNTSSGSTTIMGEGIVQGGIIIFDANGKPACMYPEETGVDLRIGDIAAALAAVRQRHQSAATKTKEDGIKRETPQC